MRTFVCKSEAMRRSILSLMLLLAAATAAAREVFPLNEGWRFFFRTENTSDNARYVTLPHSWNTGSRAEGYFLEATGNYLNDIYIPEEWRHRRFFIRFYGAQSVADLFVNGCHAGSHYGGGTAFAFEITKYVRFGSDNALLVVVSNHHRNDVLPASTDQNLYGGLYREAELIVTDADAVSPLYLGTEGVLVRQHAADAQRAEGEVEVRLLARREGNATLTVTFVDDHGRRIFHRQQRIRTGDRAVTVPYAVEQPRLWSPADPALCTVHVTLRGEQGTFDSVAVRTGFRSVRVAAGEGLAVNGRRTTVHGVVFHHDNALSGGMLTPADYDADLEEMLDMGATAVRSAVYPHAPYFYDRCDERGLLVWVDIPFHRAPFLGDVAYYPSPLFEENGLQQLREIIAQHTNHPSVVMWGIFSRLRSKGVDAVPYIRRLNEEARLMDPSRPTVACSDQDGNINFITDLIVWRQDVGWSRGSADDVAIWRDRLQKNWSHLRSAICYGGPGFVGHTSYATPAALKPNWMPEQRQALFHEDYARNLQNDSLFWGVWIGNMFDYGSARSPYGINGEGLVTLDRRERKDAFYLYRALWNGEQPTLRLADRRQRLRDAGQQAFRVYSSAGDPVLTIDGDTVAMHPYAPCQYRSDTVMLESGTVRVRVAAGELADSVRVFVGSALKSKPQPVLQRKADRRTTN